MTLVPINCSFLQTAKLMPSNVKFDYQDVVTVMLHTATSSTNSLESASNDLIFKSFTRKIPSADTIFGLCRKPLYSRDKSNCDSFDELKKGVL